MTKWEYFELDNPDIDTLNEQGEDGWELCGIAYTYETLYNPPSNSNTFYFKRPLAEEEQGGCLRCGNECNICSVKTEATYNEAKNEHQHYYLRENNFTCVCGSRRAPESQLLNQHK